MPLVAYNVNLDTNQLEIADLIAKKVRHISGGLRYCKGIGISLKDRGIVQVSMNMTDYSKTALYRVFELIRIEATDAAGQAYSIEGTLIGKSQAASKPAVTASM